MHFVMLAVFLFVVDTMLNPVSYPMEILDLKLDDDVHVVLWLLDPLTRHRLLMSVLLPLDTSTVMEVDPVDGRLLLT